MEGSVLKSFRGLQVSPVLNTHMTNNEGHFYEWKQVLTEAYHKSFLN